MRFTGIVAIGLSLFLAAKAGALELRLNCKTTLEMFSILTNDYKVLDSDPTIYNQNVEILISNNEIDMDFGYFGLVRCLEAYTTITDEKIRASCTDIELLDGRKLTGLDTADTVWSVKLNRYSGRAEAKLYWLVEGGRRPFYDYEGICSKSKKKLF